MEEKLKIKQFNIAHHFLLGIGLIIIGIIILNTGILTLQAVTYLLGIVFVVLGVSTLVNGVINKIKAKKNNSFLLTGLTSIIVGVFILIYPGIPIGLFGAITGLYCLLLSVIRGINFITFRENKVRGRLVEIILSIFLLGLGIFFLFSPYLHVSIVMNVISVYFIMYGSTYVMDSIREITPDNKKDILKRKIRIVLPPFASALIPRLVLEEVNYYLDTRHDDPPKLGFEDVKVDEKPDIEVIVHVSKEGAGIMGHVDLIYDNKVMSYGNYDGNSWRMVELVGDGVIFFADPEKYIPFVIEDSKKTLFVFGLKFNDEQKEKVKQTIEELKKNLYPWNPPVYTKNNPPYAARLNNQVDVSFYKFKEGPFKTYFVVGTNCVKLSDSIIGKSGIDILQMNGIITPGAYYDYLNSEFSKPNSMVISKKIYN